MVCGRDASSSCAGIRTVTVTGPAKTPEVLAITSFGASGSDWASTERRERLEIRSSSSATPETSRAASATAETATRADGAAVAYRTLQNPRRIPSLGATSTCGPTALAAASKTAEAIAATPKMTRPISRANVPAPVGCSLETATSLDSSSRS